MPKRECRTTNSRLYVGNLSYSTTADIVRKVFETIGTVYDVRVPTDRETGQRRGFAFVTMGSNVLADKAIHNLNGTTLNGRALRVNEAQERQPVRAEPTHNGRKLTKKGRVKPRKKQKKAKI